MPAQTLFSVWLWHSLLLESSEAYSFHLLAYKHKTSACTDPHQRVAMIQPDLRFVGVT
jgi:hypothetical protein